jgi:hypothetical protein
MFKDMQPEELFKALRRAEKFKVPSDTPLVREMAGFLDQLVEEGKKGAN